MLVCSQQILACVDADYIAASNSILASTLTPTLMLVPTVTAGLAVRMVATFVTMQGGRYRPCECLWFAFAWIPKARRPPS